MISDCWCGHSSLSHIMYEGKQSSCGYQCPCDGFMSKYKKDKCFIKNKASVRKNPKGYGWNLYFRNNFGYYLTHERAIAEGINCVNSFYKLTDAGCKE